MPRRRQSPISDRAEKQGRRWFRQGLGRRGEYQSRRGGCLLRTVQLLTCSYAKLDELQLVEFRLEIAYEVVE